MWACLAGAWRAVATALHNAQIVPLVRGAVDAASSQTRSATAWALNEANKHLASVRSALAVQSVNLQVVAKQGWTTGSTWVVRRVASVQPALAVLADSLQTAVQELHMTASAWFMRAQDELQEVVERYTGAEMSPQASAAALAVVAASTLLLPVRLCCRVRSAPRGRARTAGVPSHVIAGGSAMRSMSPVRSSSPEPARRRAAKVVPEGGARRGRSSLA